MTFDPYGKEYRATKELRNCGFTPESINAIQSTTIITRDGAQHVVPISQAHLDERKQHSQINQNPHVQQQDSLNSQEVKSMQQTTSMPNNSSHQELLAQLQEQQMLFSRHKHFTDQRLQKLEIAFTQAQEIIKQLQSTVMTMKSNQSAQAERDWQFQRGQQTKEPMDTAIDRNNVAPSQVQVDKIFYCGTR
jgi:hypothetical protein